MSHRHREQYRRGPWGHHESVCFELHCSCGCVRHICHCRQCREQGEARGPWSVPVCQECRRRHFPDRPCSSTVQEVRS